MRKAENDSRDCSHTDCFFIWFSPLMRSIWRTARFPMAVSRKECKSTFNSSAFNWRHCHRARFHRSLVSPPHFGRISLRAAHSTYTVFLFRYMPAHFLRMLFSAGSLSTCNADCACDFVKYSPICGENGNTYISGCHAGCTERIKSDGTQVYINRCFAAEMQFAKALCTNVGRSAPLSNGAKLPRPRQL